MESRPLLSICIPTFNRAAELDKCLASVFLQTGASEMIEVCVSDNASADATQEVLHRYKQLYPNLRFRRNETNVGAEQNILRVLGDGRGEFLKLHGDDDYFLDGSIAVLLDVCARFRACSLIYLYLLENSRIAGEGTGMADYLRSTSIFSTYMTALVFKRAEFDMIPEKDKFVGSYINQVYLQYAMLRRNPRFCLLKMHLFAHEGNPTSGYNYGEVFVRNYLAILRHFEAQGLSPDDIREEKLRMLQVHVLPWFKKILDERMGTDITGFREIVEAHYRDEPYVESVLAWIDAVLQGRGAG